MRMLRVVLSPVVQMCLAASVLTYDAWKGFWLLAGLQGAVSGLFAVIYVQGRRHGRHRQASEGGGDPGPGAGGASENAIRFSTGPGATTLVRSGASPGVSVGALKRIQQDEPIKAWRTGAISLVGRSFLFAAVNDHHGSYGAEATAACHRFNIYAGLSVGIAATHVPPGVRHAAPGEECLCGFYALTDRGEAETMSTSDRGLVVMEVELYGRVIVHEHGYRAEKQRVFSVALPAECLFCSSAALPAVPFDGGKLAYLCAEHCPAGYVTISAEVLASKLGTEVRRTP